MHESYGRDLDLNLLRVFVIVAEERSVTQAAARLYVTQPAVSASLRRLERTLGAAVFVRRGRGLALTHRGQQLLQQVRPHLDAIVTAALSPTTFDASTSERTIRIGLSDSTESWLLPELLARLRRHAPRMRLVSTPVQFRTVGAALMSGAIDVAVTVADDLGTAIRRRVLLHTGFVCLFDPRHTAIESRVGKAAYFAAEHVIVSYAGDLRGIVEDLAFGTREVRCSVSSFDSVGAVVDGSPLLATVPDFVAHNLLRTRPHLRTARLPFALEGGPGLELLWPRTTDDDAAVAFVRTQLEEIFAPRGRAASKRGKT